jgi:hypothetical protein
MWVEAMERWERNSRRQHAKAEKKALLPAAAPAACLRLPLLRLRPMRRQRITKQPHLACCCSGKADAGKRRRRFLFAATLRRWKIWRRR